MQIQRDMLKKLPQLTSHDAHEELEQEITSVLERAMIYL